MMPEGIAFPAMEFGLGQRITGRVSNLRDRRAALRGQRDPLSGPPRLPRSARPEASRAGLEKVAAISGKVEVPGLIRLRLDNPGAALPDVRIAYEIVPGVPDVLNIPDWAETTFRPDGKNLRDMIREILSRQELIRPFSRFAGDAVLQQVRIQELSMSTDEASVRLDFAVLAQVGHE